VKAIYFPPYSSERIDLTGVPIPGRDGWFFTPLHLFCFKTCSGWLAMGVEAPPGENRFGDYRYHAGEGSFHFSLSYDSMTSVNGAYSLPEMGIYFG